MDEVDGDIAFTLAKQLLGRIMDRLRQAGDPPKRVFVSGGEGPPADDCCAGLLWTRVAQIIATDGDGAPVPDIRNWSIPVMGHAIVIEAGILRCAPVLDGNGDPPPAAAETASAHQSAVDRTQLRMAVLCDFPADIGAIGGDGQAVGSWVASDAGGCAGGWLTTTVGYSSTLVI